MKHFNFRLIIFFFFCFPTSYALANQSPGPLVLLPEVLILPIMALLSLIGGAYPIMKQQGQKSTSTLGILIVIVLTLLSLAQEGFSLILALIFGLYALIRGLSMISWGLKALIKQKKEPIMNVNPWRLVSAGFVLLSITLFLGGMALAFVNYWPNIGQKDREQALKKITAFQMAHAEIQKNKGVEKLFMEITPKDQLFWDLFEYDFFAEPKLTFEYNTNGKAFTIYMLPKQFPFFPYHYLTSQPTYRADESGNIRMEQVHRVRLCSKDAPVVMRVNKKDIQLAREQLNIQ